VAGSVLFSAADSGECRPLRRPAKMCGNRLLIWSRRCSACNSRPSRLDTRSKQTMRQHARRIARMESPRV
jgi:hypothetical protein